MKKKKTTIKKVVAKKPTIKKNIISKTQEHSSAEKLPPTRSKRTPQSVRGFRDVLPAEQLYWRYLTEQVASIAEVYGFRRIDLPMLEATSLFERAVGKATDIVEKEMFSFKDRSDDSLTLRPEATAGAARAYIQHGLVDQPQPIKWYTIGSMFRYQRPQYGRQREFHQWNCEVIGEDHPVMDAILMIMVANLYADLGLSFTMQLNSIGDSECRPAYKKSLVDYYRGHRKELCEDCKNRLTKNPFRLLDCKEASCHALKAEAPQFVDHLCDNCREHLMKILEYLDELDVPYVLNPHLVRGLDYYTRTVFEVWATGDEEGQTSLCGGGRYDGLIEQLGGRATPAAGFALGMEATILKLKEQGLEPPVLSRPDVFIAQLSEPARRKAMKLFEELRKSGIMAAASFSKNSLKVQMEIAARLDVRYALIVGQKEIVDNTIIVRDMEAGMQEIYDFNKIIPVMQKKLKDEKVTRQNSTSFDGSVD